MRLRCCPTTGQTSPASTIQATTGDARPPQPIIESLSPAGRTSTSWLTRVVQGGQEAAGGPTADYTTSSANWRTGGAKPSITKALWQASITPLTLPEQIRTAVALPTNRRLETTSSI